MQEMFYKSVDVEVIRSPPFNLFMVDFPILLIITNKLKCLSALTSTVSSE